MDWGSGVENNPLALPRTGPEEAEGGPKTSGSRLMDLNLEGDFLTEVHPLVDVTLLDYDYLITKKKLEETDGVKNFVTPMSEFREEAFADAERRHAH